MEVKYEYKKDFLDLLYNYISIISYVLYTSYGRIYEYS